MGETFYTSDLHLDHELVAEKRGFAHSVDHDNWIARVWDHQVGPDDTVFVLGDLAIGNFPYALSWIRERPGKKHFITGNHDPVHPARSKYLQVLPRWLTAFETVQPYLQRKLNGVPVLLSHFPYMSWGEGPEREGPPRWEQFRLPEMDTLLLHGHTHGRETDHGNMFHVGWDAHGRLVSQQEILNWIDSVNGPRKSEEDEELEEFIRTFNELPQDLTSRRWAYQSLVRSGSVPKGARFLDSERQGGRMTRL